MSRLDHSEKSSPSVARIAVTFSKRSARKEDKKLKKLAGNFLAHGGKTSSGAAAEHDQLSPHLNVGQGLALSKSLLDKLKKNKNGTPDKPITPGPDDEGINDTRPTILNDEEIQKLAITQDALSQIRQETVGTETSSQGPKPVKPVNVRKINRNPPPKRITKSLKIAKGAPPRAPLKPIETEGNSGPRFDANGNVIAHSILGTLEEYKTEAEKKGELAVDYYIRDQDRVQTPTTLPDGLRARKQKSMMTETLTQPVCESVDESSALINWQKKMRERKLQQGYISRLLEKPSDSLVMNQGDKFREKQELRYLIDRSIPAVDYGKGYRVGSEFWHQQQPIGDEEKGIHMSLNQAERGYPPPIEHVSVPSTIRVEKGIDFQRPSSASNKPWRKSSFLGQRMAQLQPVMNDLDPHRPSAEELEVIGTNNPYSRYIRAATPITERIEVAYSEDGEGEPNEDPLAKHPDVYTPPVFGPSIRFAGEVFQWMGDSHSCCDRVAVDARVTFEAYAGCRSTSVLEIINLGTTAMYFHWKMLPKSNPFDLVNANVQRFYFNTSSGVILPGDTLNFPFVFKSDKAGVFSEQWQFETHPVVAGGAALVVTLRGVALREDVMKKQRELIETKLQKNIVWKNMRRLIDEIVDSIKSPERPKSPVDSYLTEQEIFQRRNPQLYYKHEVVGKLAELYKMLVDPPSMDGGEEEYDEKEQDEPESALWDLNVAQFKWDVLNLEEDDERKPSYLENINEAVMQLSFPHFNPQLRKMYKSCFHYLSNTMDNISGHSIYLRQLLGLPERAVDERVDDPSRDSLNVSPTGSHTRRLSQSFSVKSQSAGKKHLPAELSAGSASAKRSFKRVIAKALGMVQDASKTGAVEGGKTASKTTPKTASKEEKKSGKADAKKETGKGKDAPKKSTDRASPTKKTPPAKSGASLTQATSNEGRITPALAEVSASPSTSLRVDIGQEKKYKEKLTAQVYMEINRLVLDLVDVFEELHTNSSE